MLENRNLMITNLSLVDEEFIYNVNSDIEEFLKRRSNGVLLFPPVNNFRRFLIHQTCENFRMQYDLLTFSVGQGLCRRTVVCFRNQLLDPNKFAINLGSANLSSSKHQSPIKNWRTGEQIETVDSTNEGIASSSSNFRRRDTTAKMVVEKHLTDSRGHKTNTIDLYRPPALRNNSIETGDMQKHQPQQPRHSKSEFAAVSLSNTLNIGNSIASIAPTTAITTTIDESKTLGMSVSCNNSPLHQNVLNVHKSSNSNGNNLNCNTIPSMTKTEQLSVLSTEKETITTTSTIVATAAARTIEPTTPQSNKQQGVRRERRPDRAVYIPRARRSLTMPPTTTSSATATITTVTAPLPMLSATTAATRTAIPTTATSNSIDNCCANNAQQLLTVNTIMAPTSDVLVTTAPLPKADNIHVNSGNSSSKVSVVKKSKTSNTSNTSATKDRKERIIKRLSSSETSENSKINNKCKHNCDSNGDHHNQTQKKKSIHNQVNKNTTIATTLTTASRTTTTTTAALSDFKQISCDIEPISKMPNIRIEDVATNTHAQHNTIKCDNDEQEFQRASKEINRSNRRIIKQTFVSDVLEIPEKIDGDIHYLSNTKTKTKSKNTKSPSIEAATTEEEDDDDDDDDDDWENMYDESGECLDPKVIQELTASVGKVKIEYPKMDYSTYLTKQSILNEEEFPHVLEVSNFPVEFKNQDLLMVFSQYKESGFDIKWVDDTHALAVFSSARIAAEVLAMGHPFVVVKPLAEATVESRMKAKKCAGSLQPYRQRPETCAALARRLVTGALGVRLKTAAAERENEKRVLREAKERKLLAAKQRDEAWES